jgi:hypothetical protein
MKKNFLLPICLMVVFSTVPSVVYGQTATPRKVREQIVENRCEKVTSHISTLKSRLTADDTIRQNRHQKAIDRLNTIISKLEANNINAEKLKTDTALLLEKKNIWYQSYTMLLAKLDQTTQFACGRSEGEFKQAVAEAREQRMTMHKANVEFWTFVQNTIRVDIQTIRNQTKNSRAQ